MSSMSVIEKKSYVAPQLKTYGSLVEHTAQQVVGSVNGDVNGTISGEIIRENERDYRVNVGIRLPQK